MQFLKFYPCKRYEAEASRRFYENNYNYISYSKSDFCMLQEHRKVIDVKCEFLCELLEIYRHTVEQIRYVRMCKS